MSNSAAPGKFQIALRMAYFPVYLVFHIVSKILGLLLAVCWFFMLEPVFAKRLLASNLKSWRPNYEWR